MERSEKEKLAEYVIDLAKKSGAHQIALNLAEERGVSLQYRDGEIEQLQESQQSGLSVQIYLDHKYSSHSTNDLRPESIQKFVENAVNATRFLTPDKFRILPDPEYYPGNTDIDLKLTDPAYETISTEDRLNRVRKIFESAKSQGDSIISVAAGFSDGVSSVLKVNSNGFSAYRTSTIYSVGAETTVRDNDSRPEDYFYASKRFLNDLPGPEFIGEKAARGALAKIGQAKIKSGIYNTIFESRAAIRLISMLLSPLSAAAIQQKSSYMEGLIGKAVASEKLGIFDKPFIEKGLGSRLYDGDGIATRERAIIENGILRLYFIDNYYGKKLGLEPNGGSGTNLLFKTGDRSLNQLMDQIGNGLLVTGFNGGNSNATTGDFSFGISGFLFENGLIVRPINEMNISGNAKTFWKQLIETGNDPYPYSSVQAPSLLFEGISFSGL
jgi:PmbA protein